MVEIIKKIVPENRYYLKCPYEMTPEFVVVHNTANDATARNEISYMTNNDYETSFHYAVDDKEIVQGILENRNAWHAGDGNGPGNRKGIAIEICYSKSGGDRFIKAEQNAAEFIASILKRYGWGIDKVKKHQDFSNKYCPHRTLDMGWDRFLKMIESYMETKPVEPSTKHKVGDNVNYHTIYVSSSSEQALKPLYKSGVITKVIPGARNPYLIGNGTGWINDDCIVNSVEYKTISNCYWLNLRTSAGYENNIYKAVQAGTKVEYLGTENGWAKIKYDNKILYCGLNYLR